MPKDLQLLDPCPRTEQARGSKRVQRVKVDLIDRLNLAPFQEPLKETKSPSPGALGFLCHILMRFVIGRNRRFYRA
jgi:hypothetical protein